MQQVGEGLQRDQDFQAYTINRIATLLVQLMLILSTSGVNRIMPLEILLIL
jgi:hypothetical protein